MSVAAVAAPPAPEALAFDAAGRSYGAFAALAGVRLSLSPGEHVAVIGPSGAGKSTLLGLANASLAPTAGSVRVLGQDPARLSAPALRRLRARVGTVHQRSHLVAQASALENVLMGRLGVRSALATALAVWRRRDREEVGALLDQVGLGAKLFERVDRLSGGEQQRVAVARVLYQAPELVVADEPLASVDPTRSAEVLELLLEAARGRTLLLSTHRLEPVLPFFPRVVALRAGRVLFDRRRGEVSAADLERLYRTGPEAAPEVAAPEAT
ncbi:MAG TPA: ATP-binding cassette domain-containing protein [Anaeromyxobacteraceae bacterium]|jgi:phosphonate transport system ATP-binding protein|nr:ATP-binding cassette domain-containing protein [Anaeromyxobacteraceae bacterium]